MTQTLFSKSLALSLGLSLLCCAPAQSVIASEAPLANLQYVRSIESDDLFGEAFFRNGNPHFPGVGFPPGASTLVQLNRAPNRADFILASPPRIKTAKAVQVPLQIADPINIAFDSVSTGAKGAGLARLFMWDAGIDMLSAVKATPRNTMDSGKIRRFDVRPLGISNPQGLTLIPSSGQLLVLDGAAQSVVIIQPGPGHDFANPKVLRTALPAGLGKLRGIAFNPADKRFYVLNPEQQKLYAFNLKGDLLGSLTFSGPKFGVPQGMVFGPSLDQTDHPGIFHLFLLTSKGLAGELSEWALPGTLEFRP